MNRRIKQLAPIALVLTMQCVTVHAQGENAPTPAVLSIYANESYKPPPPKDGGPVAKAFGELNLDSTQWRAGTRAAVTLGESFQNERDKLYRAIDDRQAYVNGAKATSYAIEATSIGLEAVDLLKSSVVSGSASSSPSLKKLGASTLKLFADVNYERRQGQLADATRIAQREYEGNVNDSATLQIHKAFVALGSQSHDKSALLAKALEFNDEFMRTPAFSVMTSEERIAVESNLRTEIDKVLASNVQANNADIKRLEERQRAIQSNMVRTQQDISQVKRFVTTRVNQLTEQTQANKRAVDELATQVGDIGGKVLALDGQVQGIRNDVASLQFATWAQMPPAAQLEMLKNPAFLPNMKDRQDTKEKLSRTVDILSVNADITKYAGTFGDVATLSHGLGIPINTSSVQQGVSLLTNGAAAYASFALGDWSGGISSMVKFAGALRGGESDEQRQFKELMSQLKKVIELQRETLQKLDDLSDQLTKATSQIIANQNVVMEIATLATLASADAAYEQDLNQCQEFYDIAKSQSKFKGGHFPTYSDRKSHYEFMHSEYSLCESLYGKIGDLRSGKDGSYLEQALWDYKLKIGPLGGESQESIWLYQSRWYDPMLELTRAALRVDTSAPDCSRQALATLATVPMTLRDAYELLIPCKPDPSQFGKMSDKELRSAQDESALDFEPAMKIPAHPTRVVDIGQLLLFSVPFSELADPRNNKKLIKEVSLRDATVESTVYKRAARRYKGYLDITNITIAQQAVMSGAVAIDYAVNTLKAGDFGYGPKVAVRAQSWQDKISTATSTTAALPPKPWTYPLGQRTRQLPQEFDSTLRLPDAQRQGLIELRTTYEKDYLPKLEAKSSKDGYCPVVEELGSNDPVRKAAVIICLMDWHPSFARNVSLALFANSIRAGNYDLDLVEQWSTEGSFLTISTALPGLPLTRTGDPKGKTWGVLVQHPDGRNLFLAMPTVAEISHGQLSYPDVIYPLLNLREALLDRAAALSKPVLDSLKGNSPTARLMRTVWSQQPSQSFGSAPNSAN